MALHRVKLQYDAGTDVAFETWLEQWLADMPLWDGTANDVPDAHSHEGVPEHYRGEFVFEWSAERALILDSLEQNLSASADWYRIKYHVCDHDEADRGGCRWDPSETRTGGTVPDGV